MSKPNDMSEFIVHSVPGSPYGRSVFALLMEKGARYRLAPVTPATLQKRAAYFTAPVWARSGART